MYFFDNNIIKSKNKYILKILILRVKNLYARLFLCVTTYYGENGKKRFVRALLKYIFYFKLYCLILLLSNEQFEGWYSHTKNIVSRLKSCSILPKNCLLLLKWAIFIVKNCSRKIISPNHLPNKLLTNHNYNIKNLRKQCISKKYYLYYYIYPIHFIL